VDPSSEQQQKARFVRLFLFRRRGSKVAVTHPIQEVDSICIVSRSHLLPNTIKQLAIAIACPMLHVLLLPVIVYISNP
jgi:hypothetical protein